MISLKRIIFAAALSVAAVVQAAPKKVLLIAGRPSHPPLTHEHNAGIQLLDNCLKQGAKGLVTTQFHLSPTRESVDWPDAEAFKDVDCIVIYADGGGRHPALQGNRLQQLDKLMKKGVGFVTLHYGVEPTIEKGNAEFLRWQGGAFEINWSVNPHWDADFKKLPKHPITSGVKPFKTNDEWYYHMRFVDGMKGVTPILFDLPGPETLARKDGHHSGNPHVRKAVAAGKEQTVAWAYDRPGGGRGFGFTGGHNHLNWGDENQRRLVLNAIVWAAGAKVPSGGIQSQVTEKMLMANLDNKPARKPRPRSNKKKKPTQKKTEKVTPKIKAAFSSPVVTMRTPGFSVPVRATIANAKELYLIVTDGGNGYACDWADWAEPTLVSAFGKKTKLTDLVWTSATTDWGKVRIDKNAGGRELKVQGKKIAFGIGTHANSVITYKLPANHNFAWFTARGALDNGGTDQKGTSVQFHVFTEKPNLVDLLAKQKKRNESRQAGASDPKDAVANLTVHPKLQAQLFAAEPMLLNPSNIDIDHRGRIWICEVVNYRKHKGTRKEGDRILILEDTDGDAKADKSTTFFQGPEVDTAHGVTVLPTANGRNTKVIVAVGDKVLVFHDTNGDDKADKFEPLFTGISGTQHDHGIHQVQFGPDGRLYFNFGNSGRQIKDAKGKPIVDLQGNEVNNKRQPYQEGMVFRCNPDGSEFETLGWNFRNNWMVTVDSFGTMWQSDNDDDGNKGVRINYVMEYGNYGYKDELTGAGWKAKRTGMHAEIPKRHWHLSDPGVVPNVLQTGAGSPTGICIYEGDLLTKELRGQMIHCDAGPSVVRAYPVENDGAGYKATTVNILEGTKDRWFRPSDVKVAPDGSLIAADWYDPGVGGHNARHIDSGRLFRVAPKGNLKYQIPDFKFDTIDGCIAALKNANNAVRYIAWTELNKQEAKAKPALQKLAKDKNPRFRARALWLLADIDAAAADSDPNIRCLALRISRQHENLQMSLLGKLARDKSPQVRREVLITLADKKVAKPSAKLWVDLANQHDGKDRWYLEALGIAARGHETDYLDAWLNQAKSWNTPAGRDIIWRLRAPKSATYLAKILTDSKTKAADKDRYMRALDFIPKCKEKDDALAAIALGSLGL